MATNRLQLTVRDTHALPDIAGDVAAGSQSTLQATNTAVTPDTSHPPLSTLSAPSMINQEHENNTRTYERDFQHGKRARQVSNEALPEDLTSTAKRARLPAPEARPSIIGSFASIHYWCDNSQWPKEEQELDCCEDMAHRMLPQTRSQTSLRRKRSEPSFITFPSSTSIQTASDEKPRELKSIPYRHPNYRKQLQDRGSFMKPHPLGMTDECQALCEQLLNTPQSLPQDSLFDDAYFATVLESVQGKNENRVIRDITPLIVPSAEILAIRGAAHLDVLQDTINAGWNNAVPFYGPRPQPDYGLGFKREAFTREQLQKLEPFIGDILRDRSFITATWDMYLPFLTCEVKCGAADLDVADNQNAHSQTVALRNVVELFMMLKREKELHREILGFSISHSDVAVRIFGHYPFIEAGKYTFYRKLIAEYSIEPSQLADHRWTAYTFVRNVYDLWVPMHFARICSVIDDIPEDLDFEIPDYSTIPPSSQASSALVGMSQRSQQADAGSERSSRSDDLASTAATTLDTAHRPGSRTDK